MYLRLISNELSEIFGHIFEGPHVYADNEHASDPLTLERHQLYDVEGRHFGQFSVLALRVLSLNVQDHSHRGLFLHFQHALALSE